MSGKKHNVYTGLYNIPCPYVGDARTVKRAIAERALAIMAVACLATDVLDLDSLQVQDVQRNCLYTFVEHIANCTVSTGSVLHMQIWAFLFESADRDQTQPSEQYGTKIALYKVLVNPYK